MPSNNQAQKRLFIGSLPYKFTEGELLSLFIPFGKIIAVRIIHNRWGKSRGMGYVEFEELESAVEAKSKMHNYLLDDRTIIVDFAQPDPFDTPEGKERHFEAQLRRQKKSKKFSPSDSSTQSSSLPKVRSASTSVNKPYRRPVDGTKVRQSLFNSRNFHSRVGAKFAAKNKKKK